MKKIIGIALMAIGGIGFFAGNILKSKNQTLEHKITSIGSHVVNLPVEENKSYTIFLWGRTERGPSLPGFPSVEFSVEILGADPNEVIFERKNISASSSPSNDSSGGIKRAQSGCEFTSQAKATGNWTIQIDLKSGDEVTIDAYQDLTDIGNIAPGLAIICSIIGFTLFLKGRAATVMTGSGLTSAPGSTRPN